MNQIRSKADSPDSLTLIHSKDAVRKISQPVKIAQLLGSSKKLPNGQTNLVTISLPERIPTPYPKKASSQEKNVTNVCVKLSCNKQSGEMVKRRNLKFTETPVSVIKTKRSAKASMSNISDNPKEENLRLSTRRSLLVPPNTIKELHIKNKLKRNRCELPQFHILSTIPENIKSIISETSESRSMENTDADSIVHTKNKTSLIQNMSSQTFNINEQSGVNILHSPYLDLADTRSNAVEKIPENLNANEISNVNVCKSQNDDYNIINKSQLSSADDTDMRIDIDLCSGNNIDQNNIQNKIQECSDSNYDSSMICTPPDAEKVRETRSINVEKERCLSTMNISRKDLHSIKMISESFSNLQHSTNKDECVTLSKSELTVLASKLNRLIYRLEEDVSDLKLTFTTVTKLLSTTDVANMEIDNNEIKINQETAKVTENLNNNTKVTDYMELPCTMITNIDTKRKNVLEETCKMSDVNKSKFLKTDGENTPEIQLLDQTCIVSSGNKKNERNLNSPIIKQCKKELKFGPRRRSARLMAKVLDNLNVANDSFVNLENELGIDTKSNTPIIPLTNRTPAKNKYKKMERPLKEHMVLKSHFNCLLTPNIDRFKSSESKSIRCETNGTKTFLSNKVFAELYDIYGDSF